MRNLIAILVVFLAACGGGEDEPSRYLQWHSSNGLIGQIETDQCEDLVSQLESMNSSGTKFYCTPDKSSTSTPYTLGVRLDSGDAIVWQAPSIERCRILEFQMSSRGVIIGACAIR